MTVLWLNLGSLHQSSNKRRWPMCSRKLCIKHNLPSSSLLSSRDLFDQLFYNRLLLHTNNWESQLHSHAESNLQFHWPGTHRWRPLWRGWTILRLDECLLEADPEFLPRHDRNTSKLKRDWYSLADCASHQFAKHSLLHERCTRHAASRCVH